MYELGVGDIPGLCPSTELKSRTQGHRLWGFDSVWSCQSAASAGFFGSDIQHAAAGSQSVQQSVSICSARLHAVVSGSWAAEKALCRKPQPAALVAAMFVRGANMLPALHVARGLLLT